MKMAESSVPPFFTKHPDKVFLPQRVTRLKTRTSKSLPQQRTSFTALQEKFLHISRFFTNIVAKYWNNS